MTTINLAGVILLDQTGRILLLHRATQKSTYWEIPGGKIERGETSEQAAVREAYEELGVSVEIVRHLGSESFTEHKKEFDYSWHLGVLVPGSSPEICEPEKFDKIKYWNVDELTETAEPLSPNARNFLEKLISNRIKLGIDI